MDKIILYSTRCPKCNVLKKKMEIKKIPFIVCEDIEIMKSKGLRSAPALEVGDMIYNFEESVKYINSL